MTEATSPTGEVKLGKYAYGFLAIGLIGTIVTLVGAYSSSSRADALHSYLFAVILFLSLTFGCFAMTMLQHVLQARWGLPLLRIFEAGGGVRTLALMAVLLVPIGLSADVIYPWARPAQVAADHVLHHRATYLNWTFLLIRFAIYFGGAIAYAYFMRRSVQAQEVTGRFSEQQRRAWWCPPGLAFTVLLVTFAYTDYVMALDPHWWSTMYGFWFVSGMSLGAISLATVIACLNATKAPYSQVVEPDWTRDMGNLMFTFVMLWGYTNLGQYMIIWHGNLPETTTYLVNRSLGHWSYLSFALVIGQFFVPFFALLSPSVKAKPKYLAAVGIWILVFRLLDHFHVVEPFFHAQIGVNIWDLTSLVGVAGLWGWAFSSGIKSAPLFPTYDSRLLEVEHAH